MDRDRRRRRSGPSDFEDLLDQADELLARELDRFQVEVDRSRAEIDAHIREAESRAEEAQARVRDHVRRAECRAEEAQARIHAQAEALGLSQPASGPQGRSLEALADQRGRPRYRARVVYLDGSHGHFYSLDGYLYFEHHLPRADQVEPNSFTREELEDGVLAKPAFSVTFASHVPRRAEFAGATTVA